MSSVHRVTIQIETRNAAFTDEMAGEQTPETVAMELSRILTDLTDRLDARDISGLDRLRLFDLNGNAVGLVTVERE